MQKQFVLVEGEAGLTVLVNIAQITEVRYVDGEGDRRSISIYLTASYSDDPGSKGGAFAMRSDVRRVVETTGEPALRIWTELQPYVIGNG